MCVAVGDGGGPVPVAGGDSSPNVSRQDVSRPRMSELPEPSNDTAAGAVPPELGDALSDVDSTVVLTGVRVGAVANAAPPTWTAAELLADVIT